jgi:hypothetical protein
MGNQINSFLVLVSSSKHALQQVFYLLSKDVLRVVLVPQDSEVQLCQENFSQRKRSLSYPSVRLGGVNCNDNDNADENLHHHDVNIHVELPDSGLDRALRTASSACPIHRINQERHLVVRPSLRSTPLRTPT